MKRLVIGAALASGAAFAVRRLTGKARNMRDHCRDMMASCQEANHGVLWLCVLKNTNKAKEWR